MTSKMIERKFEAATDAVFLGEGDGTDMGSLGVDIDRVFLGLWVQTAFDQLPPCE